VLFGLLNVPLLFLDVALPVRLSRARGQGGVHLLDRELRRVGVVIGPVVATYCLVVAVAAGPLLDLVYGGRYADAVTIVRLFAVYYVLSFVTQIVTAGLTAQESTRPIFDANVAGAVVATLFGWIFVLAGETSGIVAGMVTSLAVVLVVVTRAYRGSLRVAVARQPIA
jgi:O-antigen/teichoic acid export membrane protein